jgi:hypothetical protein
MMGLVQKIHQSPFKIVAKWQSIRDRLKVDLFSKHPNQRGKDLLIHRKSLS